MWVAILSTGIIVGVLGVGGGIIAVPVLLEVLAATGIPIASLVAAAAH